MTQNDPDTLELQEFLKNHFPPSDESTARHVLRILASMKGIDLPPRQMIFSGTIAYNKGLGVQYFDVQEIKAVNVQEASEKLKQVATSRFPQQWQDLRVRPKP